MVLRIRRKVSMRRMTQQRVKGMDMYAHFYLFLSIDIMAE